MTYNDIISKIKNNKQKQNEILDFLTNTKKTEQDKEKVLAFLLTEGSVNDINFILSNDTVPLFKNKQITPFHYIAQNNFINLEQLEVIMNTLKQRKEYKNNFNSMFTLSDKMGNSFLSYSIRHGNVHALKYIINENISFSNYSFNTLKKEFSFLVNHFLFTSIHSNPIAVKKETLSLLDKINLHTQLQQNNNNNEMNLITNIINKKTQGLKFLFNLSLQTDNLNSFYNDILKNVLTLTIKKIQQSLITNPISYVKIKDINKSQLGKVLAMSVYAQNFDEVIKNKKILKALQKDPLFFNDFIETLSLFPLSKFESPNKPLLLDVFISLDKTYNLCQTHNNLKQVDSEWISSLDDQKKINFAGGIILFLLSKNYQINYKEGYNFEIASDAICYQDDFLLTQKNNLDFFIKTEKHCIFDFVKISQQFKNIPTAFLNKTLISLNKNNTQNKEIFQNLFLNSFILNTTKEENTELFLKETNDFYLLLLDYYYSSIFNSSDNFSDIFTQQTLLMTELFKENNTPNSFIILFLNKAVDNMKNKKDDFFYSHEKEHANNIATMEKTLLNFTLIQADNINKPKRRL